MIGTKLADRYEILERVGGGGMAVVYKARCMLLNRIVALKILRQHYSVDEDFVRRFRREAQAAASLSHPNIVSIYDVGQDKDNHFIVMEYVEGRTLKELIQRLAPMEPSRAIEIVRQIANALHHAHKNKIIHRDIKPHNVLISSDGQIKVTDFGIARAVTSTTQTFSPDSLLGSVHYFSPEQAKGKLATEQSDIYSLGIVLYEMLTNQLPFDGDSPVSIALKHLQQPIVPAQKFNPLVTDRVQGILDKLLAKDIDARYQSVTDFLVDLRTWMEDEPLEQATELPNSSDHTQVYTPVGVKAEKKRANKDNNAKRAWIKWGIISTIIVAVLLGGYFGIRSLADLLHVEEVEVPEVVGFTLDDATAMLEEQGLENYEVVGSIFHDSLPEGHVARQSPPANQLVKQGRLIELTLSQGQQLAEVPLVEGLDHREAENMIKEQGLVAVMEYQSSETINYGQVIRQQPLAGVEVPLEEEVVIYISSGPRPIEMPSLVDKTEEEALAAIRELMLDDRIVHWQTPRGDSPGGIVVRQTPEAGDVVRPGDPVDIYLRPFTKITRTVELTELDPEVEHHIWIEVTDITGSTTTVVEDVVMGYDSANYEVTGWEEGLIEVYVNNELIIEQPF